VSVRRVSGGGLEEGGEPGYDYECGRALHVSGGCAALRCAAELHTSPPTLAHVKREGARARAPQAQHRHLLLSSLHLLLISRGFLFSFPATSNLLQLITCLGHSRSRQKGAGGRGLVKACCKRATNHSHCQHRLGGGGGV
jgi:hypothetical protein